MVVRTFSWMKNNLDTYSKHKFRSYHGQFKLIVIRVLNIAREL